MKKYLLILVGLSAIILSCEDRKAKMSSEKEKGKDIQNNERILDDYGTQSYYLYFLVGVNTENAFPILIQNDNLWHLLKEVGHYSRKDYKKEIRNVLVTESPLIVDYEMFHKLKEYEIDTSMCVAISGEYEAIRQKYFDHDRVIKKEFVANKELQNCLIYLLFKNGVIIRNQDESGFLKLEN